MSNEYLDLVRSKQGRRENLVGKYAWAIPDDTAIETIVSYNPIVEVGAGSGYWANLLREAGVEIHAYDGFTKQFGYSETSTWTEVVRGGPEVLVDYPDPWTLLLIWPPYSDPFGMDCLINYPGSTLIYVGEGNGGCTGDDYFHTALKSTFKLVYRYTDLPSWPYISDTLYVYRRTVPAAQMLTVMDEYIRSEWDRLEALYKDEYEDYKPYGLPPPYRKNPDLVERRNLTVGRLHL